MNTRNACQPFALFYAHCFVIIHYAHSRTSSRQTIHVLMYLSNSLQKRWARHARLGFYASHYCTAVNIFTWDRKKRMDITEWETSLIYILHRKLLGRFSYFLESVCVTTLVHVSDKASTGEMGRSCREKKTVFESLQKQTKRGHGKIHKTFCCLLTLTEPTSCDGVRPKDEFKQSPTCTAGAQPDRKSRDTGIHKDYVIMLTFTLWRRNVSVLYKDSARTAQ